MEYLVKRSAITSEKSACAIVTVFANKRLSDEAQHLDKLYGGILSSAARSGDISGNLGETLLLHTPKNSNLKRILLVGCGKPKELDIIKYRKILNSSINALKSTGSPDAISTLSILDIKDQSAQSLTRMHILLAEDTFYQYDQTLSKKKTPTKIPRQRCAFACQPFG